MSTQNQSQQLRELTQATIEAWETLHPGRKQEATTERYVAVPDEYEPHLGTGILRVVYEISRHDDVRTPTRYFAARTKRTAPITTLGTSSGLVTALYVDPVDGSDALKPTLQYYAAFGGNRSSTRPGARLYAEALPLRPPLIDLGLALPVARWAVEASTK